MEEGPEPQELLEQVEHSLHDKHGGHHEDAKQESMKAKHMRSAITAAILAVCAALGSLLSGHAANEAILLQSKASDQWSYFQAKSTKGHLYEVNKTLIEALLKVNGAGSAGSAAASRSPSKGEVRAEHQNEAAGASESGGSKERSLEELTKQIDAKTKGYDKEKEVIQEKAIELEKESAHEFGQHQMYSFAVACFQICIVLASVSIMVESPALYRFSVAGGVMGVGILILGYVR